MSSQLTLGALKSPRSTHRIYRGVSLPTQCTWFSFFQNLNSQPTLITMTPERAYAWPPLLWANMFCHIDKKMLQI